ncbi:hypothetical protein Cni_G27516 [Canna indica]|uniref:Uncharacterized protein n=1 Tax=Canna indica TaxID=4628 RepID=A0AAQ3QPD6_9LILI|nr:hypothetical protein Cni_G27516 [Canna indica]
MAEPAGPLRTLPAGEPFPVPRQNPNPNPIPNSGPLNAPSTSMPPPLETTARAWLSTLPPDHYPSAAEIDAFIDSNGASFPDDLRSLPRPQLHSWILSFHETSWSLSQVPVTEAEFPYRFQRTDLWKPAYRWLESLNKDVLVSAKEISEWLAANPEVTQKLFSKHSRYHMTHYIQRMHLKMLKKRGKLPKGLQLSVARASTKPANGRVTTQEITLPRTICPSSLCKLPDCPIREDTTLLHKNKEAFLRYELLTDLQNQLTMVLCKQKQPINLNGSSCLVKQKPEDSITSQSSVKGRRDSSSQTIPADAFLTQGVVNVPITQVSKPMILSETKCVQKRKRNPIIVTPAWCYSEASSEVSEIDQPSRPSSYLEDGRKVDIWKGDTYSSSSQSFSQRQNIVMCLQGREKGVSWPYSLHSCPGRNREKWIPFLEGWRSLGKQFEGPAVSLTRRSCSSWIPTWCAYTSGAAIAQPIGRQGVRKVLDVRFHPEGLPQLVCSSNQAPNELLLYNLLSGKAVQLSGHNCQVESAEFAARGASIVSCGSNLLKVWDCTTGSCLFNLGSMAGEQPSGHKEQIIAMTVNRWQSCLVVTSGAKGDGKLLLWNALRGELDADLNLNLRVREQVHPSIIAMEFSSENMLVCGSDCEYGGPAVVQLWDIESPQSCLSFSANDSYITSLKIDPAGNTIITGAGDGTVGLFDMRTCGAINHLSIGSGYEVTSVSFSSCGTYLTASGTSNNTLVWDTRVLPMNHVQLPHERIDMRFLRPLHCLSHGKQMPTAEYAGQIPGHVEMGDQGVNDSQWLQTEPVLVTVSGDGSIAMWNVTLGQPCIRHLFSHTRCANTIAVAPNDEYLCTGGDDQKIVLYHNKNGSSRLKWRLSHPLLDED